MRRITVIGLSAAFAIVAAGVFAWQYFGWFKPKISVVSDVPGVSLKLVLPEKLDYYLTRWGFWVEKEVLLWSKERLVTVRRLVVHLTDKEQPYDQLITNEGKIVSAAGERYEWNGTYHLFVFVSQETLMNTPPDGLSIAVEARTLRPLLITSIDDPSLSEEARAAKIRGYLFVVNDIMNLEERIFKVEKK